MQEFTKRELSLFFVFGQIKICLPVLLRTKPCDKPVITAKSQRLLVHQDDGSEDKVIFQFEKWERLVKIEVVTEDFVI